MRLAAGLLLAAVCAAQTGNNAGATRDNWPQFGGTERAWRHSALNQITSANVNKLVPVWAFQTRDNIGGLQTTPIVVDGVMYISTSRNWVYALDAATGKQLWKYTYPLPENNSVFYGPVNRGVAVSQGRVFMGTLDNHVVALDAKTGHELWNINVEDSAKCGCNITGAPLVVKDMVVSGVTGGDSAHRGYVNAFDVRTGRQRWRFWTIPGPGEPGSETWAGDSWRFGGGSSWMTGSYDPELNTIYWSVGNPAADFFGGDRKGSNLYTDSVVALDADTGKPKWHYQEIPHDVWDFDTAYENILLDIPVNGQPRKLLVNFNKGGIAWVLDRTNGQVVSAYKFVKHLTWVDAVDAKGNLVGRHEPPEGQTQFMCPAIGGGRSFNQASFSPATGLVYNTGLEWCQEVVSQKQDPKEGETFFGGTFTPKPPKEEPAHAHLDALDPVTGKVAWTYRSKYPLLASILSTAGNLVFTGDPEGYFYAFDAKTGKQLWKFQTGAGNRGSAISYAVGGKQYIATPSGWGSALAGMVATLFPEIPNVPGGSTIFAFALPE